MTTQQTQRPPKQAERPVHEVRFGSVKAVIWRNQTANGPMHNVTLARIYRDADQWKEASSFGQGDLLELAKAANEAHSWICANKGN